MVNINNYFDQEPAKKAVIVKSLVKLIEDRLNSSEDKTNSKKFLDLAIQYKQIPDLKTNNSLMKLKEFEMIEALVKIWFEKYIISTIIPPSIREAKVKDTVNDGAINVILEAFFNATGNQEGNLLKSIADHSLLMSIENIQGNLLEEYISSVISKKPYNFIWCRGGTIKAADFMVEKNEKGSKSLHLIQIKNKYNTENSTSNKIRENTPIQKWYRLGKRKVNKINIPDYKWEILNKKIEVITGYLPSLSEVEYCEFLANVIRKNPRILNK